MMERKRALAEAFKNNTPLPAKHLYANSEWVAQERFGGGELVTFSVPNNSVWTFTNFSEIGRAHV